MACVKLEDYGRLDNLDEVAQGFQPANLVFFDIRNPVLTAFKVNQYSGKDDEDRKVHLNDFLEACSTINPDGVSKSNKRLRLFGYSLKGRAKDWLNTLSSGSIATKVV
ncbi:transposable element protein, putative [Medicago truncatula]|uniref:Transposable element protein, putative n=1 Tax=Medicago truncatula TaxID=3880 RepID=A0A072UAN7_MEDTR|nr:transposable element protein, putative [Medicago truncatula]